MPQKKKPLRSFPLSAWQVALSGFNSCGKKGSFYLTKERVSTRAALAELGMQNVNAWNFEDLPYPEQIKVLFVRAYVAGKVLMLLDDPFVCFDREAELAKMNEMIVRRAQNGGSVIVTSDNLLSPPSYASHVLCLDDEKQTFFGTREEYLNSEIYKQLSEEEKC